MTKLNGSAKGLDDDMFENKVESWHRKFEYIAQDMMDTPNNNGHYPKIDFKPLVIEFEKIIIGLREGRKKDKSLILVPGSPRQ